jgi:hypothetical protein
MDSFDMGENMGVMILQGIIILLAIVIVFMIYSEKSTTADLQSKIDSFECPTCPDIPECPDCNCSGEGSDCPACICENETSPLDCPDCPKCPDTKGGPSVDDIVNAIFPGRNPGMTSHGRFFSYEDFTEKKIKSTFQAMDDLESSTMGGGIPSRVNFEKNMNSNKSDDVALASEADPPIESGAGVFSEPSSVASSDGETTSGNNDTTATTDTTTTDTTTTDTTTDTTTAATAATDES